jgi:hypothetical protein
MITADTQLNRKQILLTADQRRQIPALGTQQGKGRNAIAYVKFFLANWTWYPTECDQATGQFFGLVFSDQCLEGEWGSFAANELATLEGPYGLEVERDADFPPQTIAAALAGTHSWQGLLSFAQE